MYAFDYRRPATLNEADLALKAAPGAKLLAGGQTLIPTLKQRLANPGVVIDLSAIPDLKAITRKGDTLHIGAMATHAEVAGSKDVAAAIPGLATLASHIGDPQVRHKGTIGGSLANNDPAADYPAAALALGATMHTNKRTLSAQDFFQGLFATALDDNEILTEISFPIPKRFAYAKFPNPASLYAMVGVAVAETAGGPRVAVTGAGTDGVFRVPALETALTGGFKADALKSVTIPTTGINGDIHGSPEYRAHLIGVMARRAVAAA
ncbi:MAG: FAD binding domain-containing protein [Hyphomicrobiaceae bacterium]|nr:carbon monoxide dehydrogenase [Hyphomicrobiaceae bacterium]